MAKQEWLAAARKIDGTVKFAQKMMADGAFQFAGDILTNPEAQRRREDLARARARFLGYREMVAFLAASREPKIASVAKDRKADLDSTPAE